MKYTNHMVWWMLGCIILAAFIFLFAPRSLGGFAFVLLPLICVLAHVFMMKGHGDHSLHEEKKENLSNR